MAKCKLDELCEFITDGTHQTPQYCVKGGVIFLSSKDVTERKINWDDVKYIPNSLHEKLCKRLSPKKNDILLAKNGTTGVAAIVDKDEVFDVYVSLAVLRPLDTIYPKYLLYAINSPVAKRQFNAGLKGIGVPNLHLGVIRETVVNVAPQNEQEKICKILDKVVTLIDERKTELELLDNLIKARFVELFGDMYLNTMRWKEQPLESMADIVSGITKGRKIKEQSMIKVPYMAVSNVKDGYIDWTTVKTIEATEQEIEQYRLLSDDVLMTEGGDPDKLGRGAIIKEPLENCIHQNHIFRVRLNESMLLPGFFAEYLKHQKAKRYFLRCAKQTTGIASINMRQLKVLPVLVPPLKHQEQFAAFVAQIDKSKLM